MNNLYFETIIYLIIAIISWGVGAIFDKLVLRYVNSTHAFYLRLITMIITFSIIIFFKIGSVSEYIKKTTYQAYLYTFLGISMAMIGVFAYLKAMSTSEASKIVPISSTYPLLTLILAVLFLGESFTLSKLIGTVLIVFGVYLISK
ncbi:MAG: EamA family transporter [Elusimicrobiales bacterium]|nr:EamA family transporter [Elusimicrobiales bacterium]